MLSKDLDFQIRVISLFQFVVKIILFFVYCLLDATKRVINKTDVILVSIKMKMVFQLKKEKLFQLLFDVDNHISSSDNICCLKMIGVLLTNNAFLDI